MDSPTIGKWAHISRALLVLFPLASCAGDLQEEAAAFIAQYEETYQSLYYESNLAEWESNTHIVDGDTLNSARTRQANEALAQFVGSAENIEEIQRFLERPRRVNPTQRRALEAMLYRAAASPQTIPTVVAERIAAEAAQVEKLYGFQFSLDGRPITPNDIDAGLRNSTDVRERQALWEASKQVGAELETGLLDLRRLRNATVQPLGYSDFFAYQVSEYGMTTAEMLSLADELVEQVWPLYRELHTWARHELARRFAHPVPEMIPAHWLPNRWAQDWSALVTVEGLDIDDSLALRGPEWIVSQAEDFYESLGFASLPASFWDQSSLYPLAADAPFKKNTHASAWHMDLGTDVRSLMSVEPDRYWYETSHHELGHVYYYMSYTHEENPLVLRRGANRAYHEGIGTLMGLASLQRRFLVGRGLVSEEVVVDRINQLLQEALNYVVFIPFSAGTMTQFEHALYTANVGDDALNATWWAFVRRFQGVEPPGPRDETTADGLTKTHINDDPAQYYDYALSNVLVFQLHDHITRNILGQDPHDSDYYGSLEVGAFLRDLMRPGASRPWRDVLRETTGRELDAQAMVDYFAPLYEWLQEQNTGRRHTLSETAGG